MNLIVLKGILMVAMLLMHLFGLVPALKCACLTSKEPLSFLNCFAAGIFMAIAIAHMLPEALEVYQAWGKQQKIERLFPLPMVIFIAGYLLVLGFEQAVVARCAKKDNNKVVEQK